MDALVNGRRESAVDIRDRGLAYGDGLFETLLARPERLPAWDAHWQRLTEGSTRLGLPLPEPTVVREEAQRLLRSNGVGVIKVVLTRGVGGRGYAAPEHPSASRIVSWHPRPSYTAGPWDGATARQCRFVLGDQPALAGIKHLNRLEQVLARREWADSSIHEGLLANSRGEVIEGVSTNITLISSEKVTLPDLSQQGVRGVMQQRLVAALEQQGFVVETRPLSWDDVVTAEHLLLTNAVIGIWPVTKLMTQRLPVKFARPEWLATLQQQFDQQDGINRHCVS